jgi:restriction endonuclease S subunit
MTKTGRINTENSSLGRAAMYVGEDYRSNVNGHVYLIRMNDIAVREFVLFIITTLEYRDYIRSVCVGGIDKRQLNKNHIENFPIILPSRKRQEDFVTLLKQVDKLKFGVQKSLDETQTLFDSLIQEYFV